MKIQHFECVDSTQNRVLELVEHNDTQIFAVSADIQTHGRGRRGRIWHSDPTASWVWSIWIPGQHLSDSIEHLTILSGVALHQAIDHRAFSIKWPNDLLDIENKKIAGILAEAQWANGQLRGVVIGVGLNVNRPEHCFDIPNYSWITKFHTEIRDLPRDEFIQKFASLLSEHISDSRQTLSNSTLEYLNKHLALRDTAVRYMSPVETVECVGYIDTVLKNGSLRVREQRSGEFQEIRHGEICQFLDGVGPLC